MSAVPIESFVNLPGLIGTFMDFKGAYVSLREHHADDFPEMLGMYHWHVAYLGWLLMNLNSSPVQGDGHLDTQVCVPDDMKPLADLDANRGFFVMVGTVALVLDLSGFDQAGAEFLRRANEQDFDTGALYMLAFDYVKSITSIDSEREPT